MIWSSLRDSAPVRSHTHPTLNQVSSRLKRPVPRLVLFTPPFPFLLLLFRLPLLSSSPPDLQKQLLWEELKAGAESGWDFSSRWFRAAAPGQNASLRDTVTSQVLPVDLNALLCRNERTLASFHRVLGEPTANASLHPSSFWGTAGWIVQCGVSQLVVQVT